MAPGTGWLRYNLTMSTKRKDTRSYSDRKEYLIQAVSKRRRALKIRAIEAMGARCMLCGYNKHPFILDIHHIDPATKTFGISSGGFSRSWASIQQEIQKCVLVCANCHREIEVGIHSSIDLHALRVEKITDTSLAPGTGFEPAT